MPIYKVLVLADQTKIWFVRYAMLTSHTTFHQITVNVQCNKYDRQQEVCFYEWYFMHGQCENTEILFGCNESAISLISTQTTCVCQCGIVVISL